MKNAQEIACVAALSKRVPGEHFGTRAKKLAWKHLHTYTYIYCLLARPHRAFQSQCYSNNIKHRKLKTQKK